MALSARILAFFGALTAITLAPAAGFAETVAPAQVGLPNPAAAFCVEQGGQYQVADTASGARSVCRLADGRVVDAWDFFRQGQGVNASNPAPETRAERIWTGGTLLTMDDGAMRAEAIAEAGGRILAVGTRSEVMKTRGPKTQVIDLKGRTLLPGFVDAHGHMMMGGMQALSANLLAPPDGDVQDIASLQETLRRWMKANAASVARTNLVIGFGYDPATLKEQRHPTRDELDAVSTDVPIIVIHQSGHLSALNSRALEAVGLTAESKDPPGGVIRRREGSQEPDGVLEENAATAALMKLLGGLGVDGMKSFAREGAKLWARYGYTTAEEGRADPNTTRVLQMVAAEGGIPIDVTVYPDILIDREFIKANLSNSYVNRIRVAGAKLSIDGSPQGFTAWRDRPYYKPVGNYPPGYSGYPAVTAEQVFDSVLWAAQNGVQLLTHANGERASDMLIAAHQAAQARFPDAQKTRPVLIHGQFLREDQVESFRRLGVIPSLFPMHTFYWGDWHLEHTAGPVDGMNISPTGWAMKRNMIFTSHHDAPVALPNSMRVLDATVTRRARGSGRIVGPEHRVDPITSLKAMTLWSAYAHHEETLKGSLEPGKLADFAILSADPTAVEPTKIADIQVVETIKEGKTIFRIDAAQLRRTTAR
ncbi:MAG: amidohydrolase family protein [Betaproteobacteria bacterium]|nr:amidohydrolase family protein [Betaproteobacteria bacterium]